MGKRAVPQKKSGDWSDDVVRVVRAPLNSKGQLTEVWTNEPMREPALQHSSSEASAVGKKRVSFAGVTTVACCTCNRETEAVAKQHPPAPWWDWGVHMRLLFDRVTLPCSSQRAKAGGGDVLFVPAPTLQPSSEPAA